MNVLPLVSVFLMIFAICSYTFVHKIRTVIEAKTHLSSSYRITRQFASNTNRIMYQKYRAVKSPTPKKQKSSGPKNSSYHSPRDAFNKREEMKLNLRTLLTKNDNKEIERISLRLLENLYFLAPFYRKELEYEILQTLLAALKNHPDCIRFEELLAFIPKEKYPLFYKLIKGTQTYQVYTTKGYPPLGDFFSLEKLKPSEKPIQFCHASRPLLEAIFGQTLAPLIINEEKHKWEKEQKHITMNKQELEAFLLSQRRNLTDYEPLLSFSQKKNPPHHEIIHDLNSGLRLKFEK